MTSTRTYSLLTIVFSFGLLLLGVALHSNTGTITPFLFVGHRIIGLIVGVLTLVLALASQSFLGFFSLILVGVQGILGGMSIHTPLFATTHFTLSLVFLTLIILIDFRLQYLKDIRLNFPSIQSSDLKQKFHYSDVFSFLVFLFFIQLLLMTFSRQAIVIENAVLGPEGISRLSELLGVFAGVLGGFWMFKSWRFLNSFSYLRGITTLSFVFYGLLFSILLTFPNSTIEGYKTHLMNLGVMVGMVAYFGVWKVNLYIREIEKDILKEDRYSFWSDLLDLTKPRLGSLVMSTVFVGMMLAPRPLNFFTGLAGFSYTFLLVMGAAAFNCWLEKDVDALMERTKNRPLPTGRLNPKVALFFSSGLMIVALVGLYFFVNTLTMVLGLVAALLYVFAYTPIKQKSVLALYVGAIPGALPPLMGWTIVMGKMTHMGWVLFWILFVWQLPHFLAISIYHAQDYQKADIKIYPNSFGLSLTKWGIFSLTVLLALVSLYPWWSDLGVSDRFGHFALFLNFIFTAVSIKVLLTPVKSENLLRKWARIYFLASIIYLPLLLGGMIYLN